MPCVLPAPTAVGKLAQVEPTWANFLALIGCINANAVVVPSTMFNGTQPQATWCYLRWVSTETFTFPVGLVGSQGVARSTATAQRDYDVQKNTVSFGTIRWPAATPAPIFISASGASYVPGDILEVFGPAAIDATLGNLAFALRGKR